MTYEEQIAEAAIALLRRRIAEKTKAALAHKHRRSERIGQVPYGHDLADDGVKLIENQFEQQIIALITQLHIEGASLRKIAAELTKRKVPAKHGGTEWCYATIARIVKRKDR